MRRLVVDGNEKRKRPTPTTISPTPTGIDRRYNPSLPPTCDLFLTIKHAMTTYLYQTIPQLPGEEPRQFEFQQSMLDQPLTTHPESGEPVRRVILGGLGILNSAKAVRKPAPRGGSGCGPGCGCH